jgi:hypothetical protein
MGAVTTRAAAARDARIRTAALGGIGVGVRELTSEAGRTRRDRIASALEAAAPSAIPTAGDPALRDAIVAFLREHRAR